MITSTGNAQVKELVRLMKKRKARDEAGVFLVEGPRMAGELLEDPEWRGQIEKVWMSESYARRHESGANAGEKATALPDGCRTELLSDAVFSHVSDTKTPQGILAVVRRREYSMQDVLGEDPGKALVAVLDNLQDPGNMGTIFRTAEAAGATGILMSSDCVDIYNPKVVRSTMGALLRMPFLCEDDLPAALEDLKKAGIRVYAAHLEGKEFYDREDYRRGTAFLIGNEGNGLREETARTADCMIRIPMEGKAESLNAAVAASILMYEASRQRRN